MLQATMLELILYGTHLTWNGVSAYSSNLSYTLCFGGWYILESRPALVSRDEGRSRFIRCALVIVMYLVATSPLSLRWTFIQGNTDDETQETTYIYSRGWILLSSMSFMAVVLITECIVEYASLLKPVELVGIGLYQLTVTPSSGNACAAQIDWMLPYFSMMLAIALLCTLVTLYHMVISPRNGGRTLWLWVKVIVKSLLLFTAAPVAYILSDMRTACPLLGVTMITSLAPILAIAQIPSDTVMPMLWPRHFELHRQGTEGNAEWTSGENREDSAV
ncbi:hypothetical protein ARMGADRAFT_1105072 [Armillaria gallica]|uniref:Uncharacterized protein n=1 Tax=Armillaria gallica TaxID=47427 RepID=A0A2H3DEQ0_ARMGA|nr:hypothetical protein ARMGADRAFT_1105072 [Armillaria gallica]